MIQTNLFTRQKETHKLREGTYGCQGKGQVWDLVHTAEFKMDNQGFPGAPPAFQETQVQFLGRENPLEEAWPPTPVVLPGGAWQVTVHSVA